MTPLKASKSKIETPHGTAPSRRAVVSGLGTLALSAAAGGLLGLMAAPARAEPTVEELMRKGALPEKVMGKADAPVTIIEYSSMTCPHCANFHKEILPGLKEKYIDTGKVRYILREFPLDNLAAAAFMLARCAGGEKYFPTVEAFYAKQQAWAFGKEGTPVDRLFDMAKQTGFTRAQFDKCLTDQKLLDGIVATRKRGSEKFGVSSTPTFFINGKLLKGGGKLKDFEDIMQPYLQG